MKLKELIDVVNDRQPINICMNGNNDFEIVGKLGDIPQKFLSAMQDSEVVAIFADTEETLGVVLEGDGDDG